MLSRILRSLERNAKTVQALKPSEYFIQPSLKTDYPAFNYKKERNKLFAAAIKPVLFKAGQLIDDATTYLYDELEGVDPLAENMKKVTQYIDYGAKENSIILGSSNPLLTINDKVKNAGAAAMYSSLDIYSKKTEEGQQEGNTMRYYSSRSGRGVEPLRNALFSYCESKGFNVDNFDIAVTHSIQDSILPGVCEGILEKGDQILLTIPTFGTFYQALHKRRFDLMPKVLSEETDWKATPPILTKMLEESPDAKLFLFTNPGNPMGEVYSKAELIALSEVIIEHNKGRKEEDKLIVFSDEVSRNSVLNKTEEFCSIGSLPGMEDCTITAWSLSKDQSPGLGVAVAIASETLINKMHLGEGPGFPMQMAVVPIFSLENQEEFEKKYEESNEIYRHNLRLAASRVEDINTTLNEKFFPGRENKSIISAEITPEGGFQFVFNSKGLLGSKFPEDYTHITDPNQKHILNSLDLCYYIREKAGVELIPGEGFGFKGDEMKCRMTISKKQQQLEKSFDLMSEVLSNLTPTQSLETEINPSSSINPHLSQSAKFQNTPFLDR